MVNLGMGMPVHVSDYLDPAADVFIHSENGVIGAGPVAPPERADPDLVDASSRRITLRPGASIVDSVWSFAMIRGGHIDVTILGAFEVAANGDLANWDMRLPNKGPLVGGAMDLAVGARAVWVIMEHTTSKGGPRLVEACTLPLTGKSLRDARLYGPRRGRGDDRQGFLVRDVLEGMERSELQARTGAPLTFAPDCRTLAAPPLPDTE